MSTGDIISVAGIGVALLVALSRLFIGRIGTVDKRITETNKKIDNVEEDFKKSKKTIFEKIDAARDRATKDREDMIEKLHEIKLDAAEKYITIENHRAGEASLKRDLDQRIGSMERHFDSRFDTLTTLITQSLKEKKQGD